MWFKPILSERLGAQTSALREVQTWRLYSRSASWGPAKGRHHPSEQLQYLSLTPQHISVGRALIHKVYSYMVGFGLVNRQPVHVSYYVFWFILWDGCVALRPVLKVWADLSSHSGSVFLCHPCLPRQGSSPAEKQLWRLIVKCKDSSVEQGKDNVHSERVYEAIYFFFSVEDAKLKLRYLENHKNTPRPWILFLL